MLQDTIARIEAKLNQAGTVDAATRKELLDLLNTLQAEIAALPPGRAAEAQRIATLTQASAHEATREPQNPEGLRLALDELSASVEEFEASYPRLVQVVNRLATTLSSLGI